METINMPSGADPHLTATLLAESSWLGRLARVYVGKEGAEDLQQSVALKALEARPHLAGTGRAWLRTVTRRTATLERRRNEVRRDAETLAAREASDDARPGERTLGSEERWELHRELVAAIDRLAPTDRELILWRFFDDMDAAQIAVRLGIESAAARKRVSRALERLRADLDSSPRGAADWIAAMTGLAAPSATFSTVSSTPAAGGILSALSIMSIGKVVLLAVTLCAAALYFIPGSDPASEKLTLARASAATSGTFDSSGTAGIAGGQAEVASLGLSVPPANRADAGEGNVYEGRVLDEARFGVSGARVWLIIGDTPTPIVRTDGEGRFQLTDVSLAPPEPVETYLRASTSDGRTAVADCFLLPGLTAKPFQLEDLILEPAKAVVATVSRDGNRVPGARVRLRAQRHRFLVGSEVADGNGRVRFESVPMGGVWASAVLGDREFVGEGHLLASSRASGDEHNVEVLLGTAAELELELEVQVHDLRNGSQPVAGAWVSVRAVHSGPRTFMFQNGLDSFRRDDRLVPGLGGVTDADGRVTLRGVPQQRLTVMAVHPWAPSVVAKRRLGEDWRPSAGPLELDLRAAGSRRTIRFPIERGGIASGATPPDGTVLELRPMPGGDRDLPADWPNQAVVEAGHVVVAGVPQGRFHGLVMAEDALGARLFGDPGEELGRPAKFEGTSRIAVSVTDEDGRPYAGAFVGARNQGNNPMGELIKTGADGVAGLAPIFGGLVDVYVRPGSSRLGEVHVGTVDLAEGDTSLECVLNAPVKGTFAFTIDGRPGLPARFKFRGGVQLVGEDPARGHVHFVAFPESDTKGVSVTVLLDAGYQQFQREVTREELDGERPISIELKRGGKIVAAVLGEVPVRSCIVMDQRESGGDWAHIYFRDQEHPNGEDGRYVFGQLAPGEYRIREKVTGRVSQPVKVVPAVDPVAVTLDLRVASVIRGTVLAPAGTNRTRAQVVVSGMELMPMPEGPMGRTVGPPGSIPVFADGTFEIPVGPSDAPTLTVWHPLLVPAPIGGSVETQGVGGAIQLELVVGPTASVSANDLERPSWGKAGTRVLLLDPATGVDATASEVAAAILSEHTLVFDRDQARFGGYAEGRYSVWIDPGGALAPLILPNVELGSGETDLGDPSFSAGASIRFRLKVAEGASAPRMHPIARSVAKDPGRGTELLSRQLNSRGESEVVLTGLTAGRFSASIRRVGGIGGRRRNFEVTLVPGEEYVVDVDLTDG